MTADTYCQQWKLRGNGVLEEALMLQGDETPTLYHSHASPRNLRKILGNSPTHKRAAGRNLANKALTSEGGEGGLRDGEEARFT